MQIKKAGNKIFGAEFTAAERRAMNMEIKRELAKFDEDHAVEIDAMVLWILHQEFGFGEKRLRRFHDCFLAGMDELNERYEMEGDEVWLCTQKLKNLGIDVEAWSNGRERNIYGMPKK